MFESIEARTYAPVYAVKIALPPALHAGEQYAGIAIGKDGALHHIILIPEDDLAESHWSVALEWADVVGVSIPTRAELGLLFSVLKSFFGDAYYWSSEAFDIDHSCAWARHFGTGHETTTYEKFEARTLGIRRVALI